MRRFLITGLTFLIIISSLSVSAQTTVVISPAKDNTIYQDNPGNSNALGGDLTAGNTSGGSPRRALIKFDIAASVPAGANITAVTLTLNCNKTRAGTDNVSLFKLLKDWGEGTSNAGVGGGGDGTGTLASVNDATWPCRNADGAGGCGISWTIAGGEFNAIASAITSVGPAFTNYSWTGPQMVADVQAWRNTPSSNFGWLIMGDESSFQTSKRFGSRENPTIAARPTLSVTYTGGLPITLLSLNLTEAKTGIIVNWETTSEFNNAYFTVEHSIDATAFIAVGHIIGAGTTSIRHAYQFIHKGTSAGQHYYRLAQTDINGNIHYSNVVSILSKSNYNQFVISPNPVLNGLTIASLGGVSGQSYQIINSYGATVKKGPFTGTRLILNDLTAGFYLLQVFRENGEVLSGSFLKQ